MIPSNLNKRKTLQDIQKSLQPEYATVVHLEEGQFFQNGLTSRRLTSTIVDVPHR